VTFKVWKTKGGEPNARMLERRAVQRELRM
jgi:hypothetical protein